MHLFAVGFADQVADRVRAILSSQAIDDEEQAQFEHKVRRSSSTGLLTLVLALAALWLLWNLVPVAIAGRSFGTGELISAGFVVLMVLAVLAVYLWDRRRESGS